MDNYAVKNKADLAPASNLEIKKKLNPWIWIIIILVILTFVIAGVFLLLDSTSPSDFDDEKVNPDVFGIWGDGIWSGIYQGQTFFGFWIQPDNQTNTKGRWMTIWPQLQGQKTFGTYIILP